MTMMMTMMTTMMMTMMMMTIMTTIMVMMTWSSSSHYNRCDLIGDAEDA